MFKSNRSVWTVLLLFLAFVSTGKADECSRPVLTDNMVLTDEAMLKNDFPDGSKVTLECAYGFTEEHGSNTITCAGGTWSVVELTCQRKDCGTPIPSPNLRYIIKSGTLLGDFVQPVCDKGYYLQGSSHRQCLPIGWSGKVECLLITCDKPDEISNGMFTVHAEREFPQIEDVIEYTCNPGYTLIGNKSIRCQEDAEYSSKPPTCVFFESSIECEDPQVQFGVLIKGESRYTSKSEAVFQCQSGYRMEGSPRIVCEEHGWSTLPVCIKEIYRATTKFPATTTSTSTSTSGTSPDLIGKMSDSPPNASDSPDIVYTVVVIVCIFCISVAVLCIVVIVRHHLKRKGSYDTGEALKTKEDLLLKTSPNLTPI